MNWVLKGKSKIWSATLAGLLAASIAAPLPSAMADEAAGGGAGLPADSSAYQLIGTKATKIARVTGATPASETLPNPNETKANYALGGTDLGIAWEATTDPAHPKVMVLFGDSFDDWGGNGGGGGGWRGNVMGISEDTDLSDGLAFTKMIADPATPNYAKELIHSAHNTSGSGDYTTIPTAGISVGDRHYIHYMQIKNWGANGRWNINFSEIAYSDDEGQTWTNSGVKWPSASKFGQAAFLKDGGYVYMFGTPAGRFDGIYLARVAEADMLDGTKYEYWNGADWTPNDEAAAVRIVEGPVGELSVAYNSYYDKYIMAYLNEDRAAIALRSSSELTGGWSGESEIATGEEYPALYGAFIHPWSLQGKDLYFLMSQWVPYNVFLMHSTLELGTPPVNLMSDPSFENQTTAQIAAPWVLEGGNGGIDRGTGFSREGKNNAFMRGAANWQGMKQVVQVKPNTEYLLSGFIRTGASNQDGYFGVRAGTGTTPLKEAKFGRLDGYTKQSVRFNSGDNTSVTVFTGFWPNGDTWIQMDDYSLIEADAVAPVVTLNGEADIQLKQGGLFADAGATAQDDIDGDITRKLVVTGSVDTSKPGTYKITYSATDSGHNTGSAVRTVTVLEPVKPTGISLDRNELSLEVGESATLTAAVAPDDADDKRVLWTSHRPGVATVSASGVVTGVAEGSAVISATTAQGGYAAVAVVTVKPAVGPAAPQWPEGAALTASEIAQTGLKLSWPATATAAGESPTVAYAVYGGDTLLGETSVASTVYQVTGLTAGTSYTFTVKAANEAGKWSTGLSVSATTLAADTGVTGGNSSPGGTSGGGAEQVTAGAIAVTAKPDADGNATVSLSADALKRAIAGVKDGKLSIAIDGTAAAKGALKLLLPLQEVVGAADKVRELVVTAGGAAVTLRTDDSAGPISAAARQLELTVAKADVSALPADVRASIGDRPAYDLDLAVDGVRPVAFGSAGAVRVAFDYDPAAGEQPGKIVVYAVAADGKLQPVKRAAYDAASGKIAFEPQHFSRYAIGYADVSFADLGGAAWAQDMIESLAARQIVSGTGEGLYAPGRAVTRAEFLQLLLNALDLQDASATADFGDVAPGAWYYGAVAAGAKLGIAQGRGDGTFGAGDSITREDMAVMLARAIALQGRTVTAGTDGSAGPVFADRAAVSGYAQDAVDALARAGLINGFADGTFAPQAQATRAQAATVIYKLLGMR